MVRGSLCEQAAWRFVKDFVCGGESEFRSAELERRIVGVRRLRDWIAARGVRPSELREFLRGDEWRARFDGFRAGAAAAFDVKLAPWPGEASWCTPQGVEAGALCALASVDAAPRVVRDGFSEASTLLEMCVTYLVTRFGTTHDLLEGVLTDERF